MELKKNNWNTWLSGLFAIFPFVIYGMERLLGILPSEDVWYSSGTNHGPWRWGWESLFVYYPSLAFMLIGFFLLQKPNRSKGILLISMQLVSLALQLYFLTWTID